MQRCSSVLLLVLAVALALALTGCLGSSTSATAGGVKSLSLSPNGNISLEIGGLQPFAASAVDGNGRPIAGADIQFIVSSPPGSTVPPPLSITSGGNACAGTWDSSQTLCSPGNDGIAIVTAVAAGVASPQAIVYVHKHIDSLQLSQAQTLPPTYDCFSQGQTWLYQATAYNNGVDITNTVGQIIWASTNAGVLTTNTNPPLQIPLPLNQVQITAASPGVTQLSAFVSGTTSNSIPVTTCLVRYVRLQAAGTTVSSVNLSSGGSVALQATAVDTLDFTLTKPPLTWISSNPEVVSFSSLTNTTGANTATARPNQGGADISAVCAPPTCNIGVVPDITVPNPAPPPPGIPYPSAMPVYVFASDGPVSPTNSLPGYGSISVDVTNLSPPTYTAWAATDQCGDSTNGCTSVMFAVTPTTSGGTNPIGTTVTIPRTPNSMMFNHQSRIYLGSNQGLMYYDVGGVTGPQEVSPASTPCNVALCGTVLTISNDGKQVVVSDGTNPAAPQVYLYNSVSSNSSTVTRLVLPSVATAAAFSPDESKIFILTNAGTMYVYSTINPLAPVAIPSSGAAVAFSPDGSFAYVAGAAAPPSGAVSAFSTCALASAPSVELNLNSPITVTTSGVPLQIFPGPILQHVTQGNSDLISQSLYVLEPPSIQVLTTQFMQVPLPVTVPGTLSQYFCNPPTLGSFAATAIYTVPEGPFTPVYASLVANGAEDDHRGPFHSCRPHRQRR